MIDAGLAEFPPPEAMPEDPALDDPDLDLPRLADIWADRARLSPMTAEQMRGADARSQRLGVSGDDLMERAGTATAAAIRALIRSTERSPVAPILILCGPGNNGGDGIVAARHLASAGYRVVIGLVASQPHPATPDAHRNWDRLGGIDAVERIHLGSARDVQILMARAERAAVVCDALLGTGVHGTLREPIRTAVDLINRARATGVPILAVDTPTAVDLTSGVPSDPVVRADVTVTFHRPKHGLRGKVGKALAGQVLVAPIGIPSQAGTGMTEPIESADSAGTADRRVTGLRDREFLRQFAIVATIGVVLQVVAGVLGGIPIIDVVLVVGTLWVMYRTLVKRSA